MISVYKIRAGDGPWGRRRGVERLGCRILRFLGRSGRGRFVSLFPWDCGSIWVSTKVSSKCNSFLATRSPVRAYIHVLSKVLVKWAKLCASQDSRFFLPAKRQLQSQAVLGRESSRSKV